MKNLLVLLAGITFLTCKTDTDAKIALLYGQWSGAAWSIAGKPADMDALKVTFNFNSNGTYSAAFDNQKENGVFHLKDNRLYTTAQDKIEKMVALSKITKDTIIMEMNRAGQSEQLVLVKK